MVWPHLLRRDGCEGVGRAELRGWCQGRIARFKVGAARMHAGSDCATPAGRPVPEAQQAALSPAQHPAVVPPMQVPRHWKFVDSFPLTVSGKPQASWQTSPTRSGSAAAGKP